MAITRNRIMLQMFSPSPDEAYRIETGLASVPRSAASAALPDDPRSIYAAVASAALPGPLARGFGRLLLLVIAACLSILSVCPAQADRIYAPEYLWARKIAEKTDPVEIADTHLRIPYRDDGALDEYGRFTTFAHPDVILDTPGLNCSGLVVSASRFLFDRNWSLAEVTRDRQGNSGENSPLGKDWDFGYDLILNLTEGRARKWIMPDNANYPIEGVDGRTFRGFDLHDEAAWQRVVGRMVPGRVYLGSISKDTRRRGYRLLHYHVVLILPDGKGNVWLYHATRRSNVHRININSRQGLRRFMSQFTGARDDDKKIALLEAELPQLEPATQTVADTGPTGEPKDLPTQELRSDAKEPPPRSTVASDASAASHGSKGGGEPAAVSPGKNAPDLMIYHLSGKVFQSIPGLTTQIPHFSDPAKSEIAFRVQNFSDQPRNLEFLLRGPMGDQRYQGTIPPSSSGLTVRYPKDFAQDVRGTVSQGKYLTELRVDGVKWVSDVFEVAKLREAQPRITAVRVPSRVQAGRPFTVTIEAKNNGAESDYGGITVSSPNPEGLRLTSAKPGRIYGAGSTVLSVTTDRIRTKVPMAERWIELWGEGKTYDLTVTIQAGRPGRYPLYVRCALRGVNVKSSVILMDPAESNAVDQQGFPVYVHEIVVQ